MKTYVISSGSYSDYNISYVIQSDTDIPQARFRTYYLESIKRSADFEELQLGKLRKFLNNPQLKSTNYFTLYGYDKVKVSYGNWMEFCKEAGMAENPHNWLETILKENGIIVLDYEEYNTDDWD
jgi:hypothetical protein